MLEKMVVPASHTHNSLCSRCNGACCHNNTVIELDNDERDFLLNGGAELIEYITPVCEQKESKVHHTISQFLSGLPIFAEYYSEYPSYLLQKDCPYLDKAVGRLALCVVYNDYRRPVVCDLFRPGSERCIETRDKRFLHPVSATQI